MEKDLTDQQICAQRLDAIEAVLEIVLPRLITQSPNQQAIRAALLGLAENPPTNLQDNVAIGFLVDSIDLDCGEQT